MKSDPTLEVIAKPIWDKYCDIYPKLKSFPMPVIRFDGRLTKTAGLCWDYKNYIQISRKLFAAEQEYFITEIIPHEIAHQVAFDLWGESEDLHSRFWIKAMRDYGLPVKRLRKTFDWEIQL